MNDLVVSCKVMEPVTAHVMQFHLQGYVHFLIWFCFFEFMVWRAFYTCNPIAFIVSKASFLMHVKILDYVHV